MSLEELPGSGRAKVAMGLVGVVVVVDAIAAISGLMEVSLLFDAMNGAFVSTERANANDSRQAFIGGIQILAYFAAAIGFTVWFYRAHKNLQVLGVEEADYSPGWAAGSFFVPILNLFRPFQVAREIWKASNPDVDPGTDWTETPTPAFIKWWWGLFLTMNFFGYISSRSVGVSGGDIEMLAGGSLAAALSDILSIAAGILAILLIRRIHARQQEKASFYNAEV